MLLKVFTVYDSKVEAYVKPFFLRSRGEAIRTFTDAVNDPKCEFCLHPGDYTLFELGDFHQGSGSFALHSTPISLGVAVEFKNSSNVVDMQGATVGMQLNGDPGEC